MTASEIAFVVLFLGSAVPSLYITGIWYKRLQNMPRPKALGIAVVGTAGIVIAGMILMMVMSLLGQGPWLLIPWSFASICLLRFIALAFGLALDFVTGCWHAPR